MGITGFYRAVAFKHGENCPDSSFGRSKTVNGRRCGVGFDGQEWPYYGNRGASGPVVLFGGGKSFLAAARCRAGFVRRRAVPAGMRREESSRVGTLCAPMGLSHGSRREDPTGRGLWALWGARGFGGLSQTVMLIVGGIRGCCGRNRGRRAFYPSGCRGTGNLQPAFFYRVWRR